MKRICIIGESGTGKSILANNLGIELIYMFIIFMEYII